MNVEITEQENPVFENEFKTKRPTVQGLEDILGFPFTALNHGFVRVVDYMGNDAAIVQAARVSYGTGTKTLNEDKGLIRYLMRHAHTTPLEMCEIKLHCKMPIFVARQWIRHRTANVNEYSARYSILDKEFYVPDPSNLAVQATTNKQGRANEVPAGEAANILNLLRADAEDAYETYEHLLNEDPDNAGNALDPKRSMLARELARMNLNLSFYTQWYWKCDLHNLLRFLSLRCDSHAQYEIRVFADIMLHEIVKRWTPIVYDAFKDYDHRQGGAQFSRMELDVIKQFMRTGPHADGEIIRALTDEGASKREADEFIKKVRS